MTFISSDALSGRALCLLLLIPAFGVPAQTAAQPTPPNRYTIDQFTNEHGLPGHQVYDIAQTADGYLWVGTNLGLARFDGYRFVVFDARNSPLPHEHVAAQLHTGKEDTLLITTRSVNTSDGDVHAYTAGRIVPYLRGFGKGDLAQDRTGRVWKSRFDELYYKEDGRFVRSESSVSRTIQAEPFYEDASGDVWLILEEKRADGTVNRLSETTGDHCIDRPESTPVLARLEDGRARPTGSTLYPYLVTHPSSGQVLFSSSSGHSVEFVNPGGDLRGRFRLPTEACPVFIDRDGQLWAWRGSTIHVYRPEQKAPVYRLELPISRHITSWFVDREQNLWIGSVTQGLFRIRLIPFQVYGAAQGIEGNVLTLVPGKEGSSLATTPSHSLYRIDGSRVTLMSENIQGIFEDREGRQIYSRPEQGRNMLYSAEGGVERLLGETGRVAAYQQILADPHEAGVFWTHDAEAIYRLTDPFGTEPDLTIVLRGLTQVRQLIKDQSGALWIATHEGLHRVDDSGHVRFTSADGLPSDRVRAVHADRDGILWIGTYGGGLARFKDHRFQTVDESRGLAEDVVSTILEDDNGYFWMSGNLGVHRTSRRELNALLDGEQEEVISVLYGRESGLSNPEASGLPGFAADDGRLWFPTFGGAAVVDPDLALQVEQTPPLVHIQELRTDDTIFEPRGVALAAGERRFEISYVGLSLRHPEGVLYRYRLDGFDPDWIEAGPSRRATYTNVTPGRHVFHVQARSSGGVWNTNDAVLTVHVPRLFYETRWFLLLCTVLVVGGVYGGFRIRMRQARARERALETRIQERTSALAREKETVAAQAEALRSLDEAKSRFFANISHEFRTPLTLILGSLQDLQNDVQDGLQVEQPVGSVRQINAAMSNSRRLLDLVEQLLDVSRLESGRVELRVREHDMTEFVERQMQMFVPMSERKQITFRFEQTCRTLPVYFDSEQFEKVMTNLLGNAFKFTPEKGTIVVSLDTEETPDGQGMMVLAVRDSGRGISQEDLPFLFERFFRAESTKWGTIGTGVGLALVKSLVELHSGAVTVDSHIGVGTTFTVRLPMGHEHFTDDQIMREPRAATRSSIEEVPVPDITLLPVAPEDEPAERNRENLAGHGAKTLVFADDNPEIRAYVRRHLARRYTVHEAADGREALELIRNTLPDLIVSDVMMPDLDGFELCRAVKQDPELNFVPIILLTARASRESRIEGLEEGADDYLTKPFDVRELEVRIENLIASRQTLKKMYASLEASSEQKALPRPSLDEEALFAEQVRNEIAARLSDENFGVDELAAAVGLGRTTLFNRVATVLDQTPMDLIWSMRLERAGRLLVDGRGSVGEVAYGVGFKTVAHFSSRFRDHFGMTPTAYRTRHGSGRT